MENFNDTIGNRTRDLPACSAVPQPLSTVTAVYTTVFDTNIFYVLSTEFLYFLLWISQQESVISLICFYDPYKKVK